MAKILVLGGTGFLGPEVVGSLLARKHEITLFNRGKTHAELFPGLEKLTGDRAKGDLKSLEGRSWDVVVDVGASQPKWVKGTAELLASKAKAYVFVSTVSVYADLSKPGITETSAVHAEDSSLDTVDAITGENYGPMKVRSEAIVRKNFPQTATIVRPGLIVGPTDPTDRFTYWPYRINRGGEVLCPGDGQYPVQFIDVRDLGNFIAALITDGHTGTYNAVGPAGPTTMMEFLHACKAATSQPVTLTWVDEDFLLQNDVHPWSELPIWAGKDAIGIGAVNHTNALAHGLTFRPLADTIRDTLAWNATQPPDRGFHAGINRDKAKALLEKWHALSGEASRKSATTSHAIPRR